MDNCPFSFKALIYNSDDTQIWTVTETDDWVIKIASRKSDEELQFVLASINRPCKHQIQIPSDITIVPQYGYTKKGYWYIMRKYAHPTLLYMRNRRTQLVEQCLAFLADLHHQYGFVHCDIKFLNILFEPFHNQFIFSDYDLVDQPKNNQITSGYNRNYRNYFYRYGAEKDKPCICWRMDLTMLMYLLMDIDGHTTSHSPFISGFTALRFREPDSTQEEDALFANRAAYVECASPSIQAGFEHVAQLAWDSESPPPREFYKELAAKVCGLTDPKLTAPTPHM